jgi:hypothetical protein
MESTRAPDGRASAQSGRVTGLQAAQVALAADVVAYRDLLNDREYEALAESHGRFMGQRTSPARGRSPTSRPPTRYVSAPLPVAAVVPRADGIAREAVSTTDAGIASCPVEARGSNTYALSWVDHALELEDELDRWRTACEGLLAFIFTVEPFRQVSLDVLEGRWPNYRRAGVDHG